MAGESAKAQRTKVGESSSGNVENSPPDFILLIQMLRLTIAHPDF